MAKRFYLQLYSDADLLDRAVFDNVWGVVADALPKANRWGPYERTTEPFTSDAKQPHRVFESTRNVFVSGSAQRFLVQIEQIGPRLSVLRTWIAEAALEQDRSRAQWLAWMYKLIEAAPCLYGFGVGPQEYDAKHVEETEDEHGAVGVSFRELSEFLPGVYWLTVFGDALAKALKVDKLEREPGLVVKALLPHQIVVLLDEPATPRDLEQRLERERSIAKRLSDEYFFDRARPGRKLRAVPAFRSALQAAEAGDW